MYSFIQLGALMLNKPSATSAGWVLQWIWWTGSWLTRTWSLEPITVAIKFCCHIELCRNHGTAINNWTSKLDITAP
uniref:Uncharacterized protein n=2 Tax=Anguilla anguilla TaxID=7936 RepID=A0A0E9UC49_ANGAN